MTTSDKQPSRLEQLFSDLGDASHQPPPEDRKPDGWTWSCDPQGHFNTCSPEIEALLGYKTEDVIGQDFTRFALGERGIRLLDEALQANQYPVEIVVHYQGQDGSSIPVNLHISEPPDDGQGWRGFSQVIPPGPETPRPSPTAVEKPALYPSLRPAVPGYPFLPAPLTSSGQISLSEKKVVSRPSELAVPIQFNEEQTGLLELIAPGGREWSEDEKQLVQDVAYQLSLALENAFLFQQTETQAWELEVLNDMGQELSAQLEMDQILDTIYQHTSRLISSRNFFIAFYDDNLNTLTFPLALENNQPSPVPSASNNRLLTRHVIETKEPLLIAGNMEKTLQSIGLESAPEGKSIQSWLGVPMLIGEEVMGIISLQSDEPNQLFTTHDRDLLLSIARQAAVSIQNARLFLRTQEALNETQTLLNISSTASQTLILENALQEILDQIISSTEIDVSLITLLNTRTQKLELTAERNLPADLKEGMTRYGIEGTLCQMVYNQEEPLAFNSLDAVPREINTSSLQRHNLRSYLGIPISVKGETIGTICSFSTAQDIDIEDNTTLLMAIAQQLGVVIENTSLFEEIQRRSRELTLINRVVSQIAATLDLKECMDIVAREISQAFDLQAGIALLNETGSALNVVASYSPDPDRPSTLGREIPVTGNPSTKKVFETRQPVVIADAVKDPLTEPMHSYLHEQGIHSMAVFPIITQNQVMGTLGLDIIQEGRSFSEEELQTAQTIVTQAATAIQNIRLYEDQIKTAERLREVDKLKSQFLANMSHELRTPLNSIIGFSRVILKGIDGPVTNLQQQDLTAIYESGQHLLNMINDILDISKIEAGKMELSFEEVDLAEMVNSVLSTAVGLVKDKPIELVKKVEKDLPLAWGDPIRLRQVLLNFLSNAAKFTDEGSITVTARSIPDNKVFIGVTDTGPGITQEDQEKLFQRFSQVDSSTTRKAGGTGLGLSISQQLIQMQNGEIGVDSQPGRGSTFYFIIPVASREQALSTGAEGRALLCIDDDPRVIDMYEKYLSRTGYLVFPLTQADQVIKYIRDFRPDIITLDVLFANGEGWEILTELKEDPELRSIPVIVCTMGDEEKKALDLGADVFLAKPILEKDLITAVERMEGQL